MKTTIASSNGETWTRPILMAAAMIISLYFFGIYVREKLDQHAEKQYDAWCKHTGNPGKLTFEEFKCLPVPYKYHRIR